MLKDYESYLKIERAMSRNTVASYCSDVEKFMEMAGCDPRKAGHETVEKYLASLTDMKKRSQARILSALRSFFGWMVLEGYVDENPCDVIDSPKLGRYLPDVLSVGEIELMIGSVDTSTWQGMRDRAILEVLYGCGLRVSEAVGLKISGIYEEEGFIRIVGKGDKERLVPFLGAAPDAVRDYLQVRPQPVSDEADDLLFLNRFGRSLSRVSMFKMVQRQALLAGIKKKISPHTFRHSFATHMIENGADLRGVQDMLGHESITTTEIYTHIDSSTWHKDVAEHHPRGDKSDGKKQER